MKTKIGRVRKSFCLGLLWVCKTGQTLRQLAPANVLHSQASSPFAPVRHHLGSSGMRMGCRLHSSSPRRATRPNRRQSTSPTSAHPNMFLLAHSAVPNSQPDVARLNCWRHLQRLVGERRSAWLAGAHVARQPRDVHYNNRRANQWNLGFKTAYIYHAWLSSLGFRVLSFLTLLGVAS